MTITLHKFIIYNTTKMGKASKVWKFLRKSPKNKDKVTYDACDATHTPPEWATCQKSSTEKWYTTYCQGTLGVPKNVFGQI